MSPKDQQEVVEQELDLGLLSGHFWNENVKLSRKFGLSVLWCILTFPALGPGPTPHFHVPATFFLSPPQ